MLLSNYQFTQCEIFLYFKRICDIVMYNLKYIMWRQIEQQKCWPDFEFM